MDLNLLKRLKGSDEGESKVAVARRECACNGRTDRPGEHEATAPSQFRVRMESEIKLEG